MGECVEKIYCRDRGDNDNVLAAAILANNNNNNRYGYGDFGMNGWMNNPFAYLMFLAQRQIADFRGDLFLQNCKDTAELRNGQRDLGQAITQGFAQTAYQAQQDKCDIIRAGQDNTQRIIDTLNNHWKDEQALKIQDLKFELSQECQNNLINERFNRLGNCGCGWNNNCGCGNGCGC